MFVFLESNGGYCVYYPSNIFCNMQDLLKIGECHSDVPQFCPQCTFSHVMHLDQSCVSKNI